MCGFDRPPAVCYKGNDVRFRRMPYLTVFVAVMFFASSAAAAARACIVDLPGQEHVAVRALDAEGNEHLCPQSDDVARCLTHCTQSYKSDVQQFSADVPLFVLAPAPAVFHAPIQARPKLVIVALVPHIVGPPLTILYRNFRN
jgi:hypothetical protein